nr:EOG090X0MWD [Polyphemus pediculus]
MTDDPNQQIKIQQYETFINEVLRTKLKNCLVVRETCQAEIHEYLELQRTIENFSELDIDPLKAKVDLGCGFFVQAEVKDSSKILVAVGFGFYLELKHTEAISFIAKKINLLTEHLRLHEEQSSSISADIKIMLNTLGQLQGIQGNVND